MTRILYAAGHSRIARKWGMVGEVAKRLMENPENEIYYLDCNGNIKGPCGLNHKKHWGYCRNCQIPCLKVLKHAGLPDDHILKMQKYKTPKFPYFNTIQEAIDYEYEGYNLGLAPVSCIMTITRDYDFDIKKWQKHIKRFFETEYIILKNIEYYDNIYHFDEIHSFNGRMASMYPYVVYAKKHNIDYTLYEGGYSINRLSKIHNCVPHDINSRQQAIQDIWEKGSDDKYEIAKSWYEEKRQGKTQIGGSYTKYQSRDQLPKNYNFDEENIVYFNSSADEIFAFPSWRLPFCKTENEIIEAILEHYKDDNSKHFYIRVHPNLKKAKKKKTTQIRELNKLKNKYQNLTIIEPEDKTDTYSLMKAADKVITTYSSIGAEATYHECVSILTGLATYQNTGCVYQAKSLENIFELIDDKTLKPKPKETSYPYGYFFKANGEPFKYLHMNTYTDGEFCGMKLTSR